MAKKGKKQAKKKTHVVPVEETDPSKRPPKTLVFKVGRVGLLLKELRDDLRRVMEPHTAIHLKEKSTNALKDFLSVAGPLGVTHFLIFSATDFGTYLRAVKVPRGPTLTFRIHSYSLMRDVVATQLKPHSPGSEYRTPPLVVLNNFPANEEHSKLMSIMFQNLFPPINVQLVKLSDCRRVVLFSYNKEDKKIEFRHYLIKVATVGINKNLKRIVRAQIPNLNKMEDISDFVLGNNNFSDSEAEDGPENRVVLSQDYGGKKATTKAQTQSAIRLQELGPRMQMQLIKIEDDFCGGKVVFHEYVKKTPDEIALINKKKEEEKRAKEQRKKQQEKNVRRKSGKGSESEDEDQEDDDVAWYKQEVGEEPERDDFKTKRSFDNNKKGRFNPLYKRKKERKDEDNGGDDEDEGYSRERKGKGDDRKTKKKFFNKSEIGGNKRKNDFSQKKSPNAFLNKKRKKD